jgi:dephospho-CoA kinase
MKKIGITGGIGVGKTYVSDILERLNYPVYNSDVSVLLSKILVMIYIIII